MHRIFGVKEDVAYTDRQGAYLIPVKDGRVGVVRTPKGYFLLGGGLDDGETDEVCIERECLEEVGYRVSIHNKTGSAETYYRAPEIGYFHPIQTYYAGELLEMVQTPAESDHKLVWVKYDDLKGKMYMEMQNWAVEECWKSQSSFIAEGFNG